MTETGARSQDASEQKRWFEAAAKAGDAEGMYRFGLLSEDRDWLRKAAEKGNAPAMVALGDKEWVEKAAAAGYANAFTKLGQLEKAARMGDPEAKMLLGDAMRHKKPKQAIA
jgi:TPR repeat protein